MTADDVREEITHVLSANWRNMHTNESLGYQRMLADAILPILARREQEAYQRGRDEERQRIAAAIRETMLPADDSPAARWAVERAAGIAERGGA